MAEPEDYPKDNPQATKNRTVEQSEVAEPEDPSKMDLQATEDNPKGTSRHGERRVSEPEDLSKTDPQETLSDNS